ncbi:MAG: hypothetical protein LC112_05180 [Flavobacteriales bacterium]|nr:hypothetical protein [Flavobacteriales bacterium]
MEYDDEVVSKLRLLVKVYENANSPDNRKKARQKMQKLNFRMTDYDIKGITSSDFEQLISSGRIRIGKISNQPIKSQNPKSESSTNISKTESVDILNAEYLTINSALIANNNFSGFYSLRLKDTSKLPLVFQNILKKRDHKIIYFGKAETQTLAKRLNQELYAKGHGTFYRSIGAVLGYLPENGSLKDKANQNNYKFAASDNLKITKWIEENLEIAIFRFSGDFKIENAIIKNYTPLLNDSHNPLSLTELKQLKDQCRKTARN